LKNKKPTLRAKKSKKIKFNGFKKLLRRETRYSSYSSPYVRKGGKTPVLTKITAYTRQKGMSSI